MVMDCGWAATSVIAWWSETKTIELSVFPSIIAQFNLYTFRLFRECLCFVINWLRQLLTQLRKGRSVCIYYLYTNTYHVNSRNYLEFMVVLRTIQLWVVWRAAFLFAANKSVVDTTVHRVRSRANVVDDWGDNTAKECRLGLFFFV